MRIGIGYVDATVKRRVIGHRGRCLYAAEGIALQLIQWRWCGPGDVAAWLGFISII